MDSQGDLNITNFDSVYPDTQAPHSLLSALLQGDNTYQNYVTSDDHITSLPGYMQHAPLDIGTLNEEAALPETQLNDFLDDGSSYSFYDTHDIDIWNAAELQKPQFISGYDGQLQQSPSVTSTQNLSFFEPDMASRDFDSSNASLSGSRSNSRSRLTGSSLSTPISILSESGMDPMQRWRESPPETEAASLSAIADALRTMSTRRHARADHLAGHFRQGLTMSDWKGDHCFEPSIAAQIKNAFPPYLLASEAKSMVPFSATDPATLDHLSQIYQRNGEIYSDQQLDAVASEGDPLFDLTPTSYMRWVTFRLGRFAQQSIANGIFPTDKMFQDESRRLVYGDKDAWEQTVADNNEWLAAFRRQCLPPI
ncbi:hypothetical protein ANOM_007888 [Aspergillus nomiae NRRL 13137]|uniref:Uncharacterized protein n=1 Tax=Aspergillus nomiae NRRL (strain ATCC 15546 / NRRL 13137 / CBS 260.88 / M93) TaxID=1509407 RepID=A0A0L1IYK9_ASPN3|nr:uncharacterized protein ANOM_007888 [Aspergillus nomiae NRRL 13137]KNG84587.1 hypothetical protein ANOM_007888 [Aspergillus nomiae NRRL 13137]